MRADPVFHADPGEPLGLWTGPRDAPAGLAGVRATAFEYSSRGDRVPGRLLLPEAAAAPPPLVLLQHGAGGSKDAAYLDAVAGPWVRGGAAVASIDFPLHGERADAKLTPRLLEVLAGVAPDRERAGRLLVDFARQAVGDLARALDALERVPEVDAQRVAYAGFSLGTVVGATFCALDPRPRAAALAVGGSIGFAPVDPVRFVGRLAPRPLLVVGTTRDERFPRATTQALYDAAGEPREILWFEGTHSQLPGRALKAMWLFLRRHLGLEADGG